MPKASRKGAKPRRVLKVLQPIVEPSVQKFEILLCDLAALREIIVLSIESMNVIGIEFKLR